MAVDKKKNTQLLITIPQDLLADIENYWHDEKLINRSEAIRDLLRKGLAAKKGESDD